MKNIIERIAGGAKIARYLPKAVSTRLAVAALAALAAGGAGAATDKTNPVTGATESYVNTFLGTNSSEWNAAGNWDTGSVPFVSGGVYTSALVDGEKTVTSSADIDLWHGQIGAYNGASITIPGITKIQATGGYKVFLTADRTSKITINAFRGNQLEGSASTPIELTSAQEGGITWNCGLTTTKDSSAPFHYYLDAINNGSVVYTGDITVANEQVVKQVNVKLTGTSQVSSKTLVTFGSGTTKTFTAAAAIKVYDTDGSTLKKLVGVTAVRQSDATIANTSSVLTTADAVGTCEIVQCTDGIVLYYVDGAPDTIAAYKPSININFTNGAANGLTTTSDVGLEGYAVPGTAWNNFVVANNTTYSTVNAVDSTGAASVASGVSVTVSGTRGHWNCSSLTPATNPLHGYIDESSNLSTPTVTITGIPYDHYRVIVYHSTDQNGAKFGYDTINGFNFTYVDGVQQTGTTSWGSAGASNSAEAIAEGVNTLVSAVLTGDTVTMVAHRIGGDYPSARGCFAAIQVVEYVPEVGENDLEIAVNGATNYAVDEAKTLSGTVYLTGSGTLTLTGSEKITAATIDVAKDVVLNINADRLDATTFTGSGTVVYDNTAPVTGKGWAAIGWSGTVWVKNWAVSNFDGNNFGNAASTIRFTGVTGYLSRKTTDGITQSVPIELVDDGNTVAFSYNNGWGGSVVSISTLKGTGTLKTSFAGNGEIIYIANADGFTGSFDLAHKKVQLGGSEPSGDNQYWDGRLYIPSGATATVASGATWTANNAIDVQGTLNVNGTLASTHASRAVIGSGTVVFTGRAPTPTGDTWWKNANWTGTVQIDSLTGFIGYGNGTVLAPNDYGNTGSTLELKNCSGWLPVNYECSVPLSIAGTLTIGDGHSGVGNAFTIDHLRGSGQITCSGSAVSVLIYVREWSGYTGKVKMDNKMIVFGADTITENDLVSGTIYICEGAVVTNRNASHWDPAAKMKVNGTFAVTARSGWSEGKGAVLGENGIINFIGSGVDDHNYNFSNITGSGKILFTSGTGYSMLPSDASRMPSTDVAVVNDNTASYVVLTCTSTTTIGTLSGSGKFDSRYGNATTRRLAVVQGADSEWSGTFVNDDRVGGMDVSAKSGAAAKTLTLSGKQTASNELVVQAATETTDAGSVNLTGTWVGNTTVSGTFGGTGTLTGNLTFSDGATFKAFDSDDNGLAVSGSVAFPITDDASVMVDLSDITLSGSGTTLITTTGGTINDISKLSVSGAVLALKSEGTVLKAYPIAALVEHDGTTHFYDNIAQAMSAAMLQYSQTYDHFELYASIGETVSLNAAWLSSGAFKLKTCNGATVTVQAASAEYSAEAGEADENEIVTYTGGNAATTYTWNWSSGTATWNLPKNWTYGNGTTATRAPVAGDTVVFNDGATVTLGGDAACAAMTVNGAASISGAYNLTVSGNVTGGTDTPVLSLTGAKLSLSASSTVSGISLVLADANATLVVPSGVTVPVPTTTVPRHVVKATTVDGTTTYSVVAKGFFFMTY